MPGKKPNYQPKDKLKTIYPAGLEFVPLRFAICKRNEWMIDQADYVVNFVEIDSGGASKYKKLAKKRGKITINLSYPNDDL